MLQFSRIPCRLLVSILLAILPFATVAGCAESETRTAQDNRPSVVVTTAMIGDVVKAVAGDHANVSVLVGPGVDPHQFRATRSHTALIASADLVIANGLMLEAKLLDSLERSTSSDKLLFVGEAIDPSLLLYEDQTDQPDPHLWMDPLRWAEIVPLIEERLGQLMPEHSERFRENAAAYTAELDELHRYAAQVLGSIPDEQRLLVTAHDAFGYLADRYDIQVEGIQGLSTESEAGLNRIEELVSTLVSRKVRAVFIESSVTDRNIMSLLQGGAARGHEVVIGGELFSDAMGPPDTYEGTYIGMIDHNVTVIAQSLGGEAPAGGLRGRLAAAKEPTGNEPAP